MRAFAAWTFVAFVALAGCSSGESEDATTSATGTPTTQATTAATGTTTGTPTTSTGTQAPANQPPSATLNADVATGGVPLNVTFSLAGADPEEGELSWSLDFGDGTAPATGTELPTEVLHTFAAAGNHTATLVVTDAAGATANATFLVQATAGAAAPTGPVLDVTASWTASLGGGVEFALGCQDTTVTCASIMIPAEGQGRPYTATFTSTAPGAVYFLDYYAGGDFQETIVGDPAATTITGDVPNGVDEFRFYASGGAQHTVHLVVAR